MPGHSKRFLGQSCSADGETQDERRIHGPEVAAGNQGRRYEGSVDKEEAAMIFWAWRNLYAEVTRARIEGKQLDPEAAYKNFVRMAFTRVVAYGAKWYRWFSRQRYRARAKAIPIRFRERKLITSEATAEYSLAAPLQLEYKRLWPTTGPP